MTSSAPNIQPLADLLDSRQDLREILAKNLNLAHACLLLRRGESESVSRALELALRQSDSDTNVVAECIQAELLRLAGDNVQAIARAEALALKERFHPAAALYLRNLFPLVDPSHRLPTMAVESASDPHQDAPASVGDSRDSLAMDVRASTSASHDEVPQAWAAVANAAGLILLRLRSGDGHQEVRSQEVAVGAMEEAAFARSQRILANLGFGDLRHVSFEGDKRVVHAWRDGDRSALAVFDNDGSASLLAARCSKVFQEAG
ncbi:MAG TPA: hypothetical protein PKO15_09945 [Fibrobacteria bacterium]|nr:hypothetical protein [Fibrobacteria bacterium]HOX52702.1 hypothetical protein [Fibrobacteria bacterium]